MHITDAKLIVFQQISLTAILMLLVLFHERADAGGHAHSFQHFHGPVIGNAREVTWKDKHGHHDHDYVAHPHYEFSYGVEDHHTGDYHGQKEHRDGTSSIIWKKINLFRC